MAWVEIGQRMKEFRCQLKMTQREFGIMIGVGIKTVFSWERGDSLPPGQRLAEMREKYGLDVNWLLCGDMETREQEREYEVMVLRRIIMKLEKFGRLEDVFHR